MNNWSTSPFGSPSQPQQQPLQRNYSEIFDPKQYECKTDIELESYARNLSNYLDKLLKDTPFPAFLFEKLEKRYNGILCMLKKRSAAKSVSVTPTAARQRLIKLNASLDALSSTQPVEPEEDYDCEDHRPPKKQRLFEFNEEVRRQLKEDRKRKERPKGEEEEEEEEEQ